MSKAKMVPCDFDRLNAILISKGLRHNDVAEELGYARGYFNNVSKRRTMSNAFACALERNYNIKPVEYTIKETEVKAPAPAGYSVGEYVTHKTYGKGVITATSRKLSEQIITILFKDGSKRDFSAQLAPITRSNDGNRLVTVDIDKLQMSLMEAIGAAISIAPLN